MSGTRLLDTRTAGAERGWSDALEALGFEIVEAALMGVERTNAPLPVPFTDMTHTIVTSRHAVASLAAQEQSKAKPVYAVGEQTAAILASQDFSDIRTGPGDAAGLATTIASELADEADVRMLYPCSEQTAFDMVGALKGKSISCTPWPVYRTVLAEPEAWTRTVAEAGRIDIVALHSARAARHFGAIAPDHIATAKIAALSPQIAESLPSRWRERTQVAAEPKREALLLLFRQMR